MQYEQLVKAIYLQYAELISQLDLEYGGGFVYPIRSIDKILWSIGKMDQPFVLGGEECALKGGH